MNALTFHIIMIVVGLADVVLGTVAARRRSPNGRNVAMLGAALALVGAGEIIKKAAIAWLGSIIADVGALGLIIAGIATAFEAIQHRIPTSTHTQ